jgi:hypothetical protein
MSTRLKTLRIETLLRKKNFHEIARLSVAAEKRTK